MTLPSGLREPNIGDPPVATVQDLAEVSPAPFGRCGGALVVGCRIPDGDRPDRSLATGDAEPAGDITFVPEQAEETAAQTLVDREELKRHRRERRIDEPVRDGPVLVGPTEPRRGLVRLVYFLILKYIYLPDLP